MQYSNYEYVPITEDIIPLCRETAASWVETHHEEGIEDELVAINLLFESSGCLRLKRRRLIKLFGRVEAFSIGELMNDRMALIHIEKANPDIRGLYQAINNEFIRHEFSNVEFINREEDMGLLVFVKRRNLIILIILQKNMMLYMLMKQIMQRVVNNQVNLIMNVRVVLYGTTLFRYNKG